MKYNIPPEEYSAEDHQRECLLIRQRMGLEPGDLVTLVNGRILTQINDFYKEYRIEPVELLIFIDIMPITLRYLAAASSGWRCPELALMYRVVFYHRHGLLTSGPMSFDRDGLLELQR